MSTLVEESEIAIPGNYGVSLRSKMLEIMRDVAYIQRDKRNEFHKYSYASEAAIKADLHAALVKHGVLFHHSISERSEREVVTDKGGRNTVTTIDVQYWFEDVETGETTPIKTIMGSGADPLDKGVFKAITGALKYALTGQFLIATGDDPEGEEKLTVADKKAAAKAVADRKLAEMEQAGATIRDVPSKPLVNLINDGQRKRMYALASGMTKEAQKKVLSIFGFGSSKDVTTDMYDRVCRALEETPRAPIARHFDAMADTPDPMDCVAGEQIYIGNDLYEANEERSAWRRV